jgi:hypothetical protein
MSAAFKSIPTLSKTVNRHALRGSLPNRGLCALPGKHGDFAHNLSLG